MPFQFLPDVDPRGPELITHCLNWEPTRFGGYGSSPTLTEWLADDASKVEAAAALSSDTVNALYAHLTATTRTGRLFMGTYTRIYEIVFNDSELPVRLNVSSGSYTGARFEIMNASAEVPGRHFQQWDFANIGNVTLAVNGHNVVQRSIATVAEGYDGAAFTNIASSPKALTCEAAAQGFLMLGNIYQSYGSVTGTEDMVCWSALGNYTDFVPSQATQAGFIQLTDTPGPITAIQKLGEYMVAFKANSMYLGQYVGSPFWWSFSLISDRIGTLHPQSVVAVDNKLIFVGEQNEIFSFDGTRPESISIGLRDTLMRAAAVQRHITVGYSPTERLVTFYGCGVIDPADSLPGHLVYDYDTGRWGMLARQGFNMLIPCRTHVDAVTTWDAQDPGPEEVHFMSRLGSLVTNFGTSSSTSGRLYNRRMAAATTWAASSFLTGAIGSASKVSTIKRLTPVWMSDYNGGNWAGTVTVTPYVGTYALPGFGTTPGTSVASDSRNRIDLMQSAHWHRFKVAIASATKAGGSSEYGRPIMLGLEYDATPAGKD